MTEQLTSKNRLLIEDPNTGITVKISPGASTDEVPTSQVLGSLRELVFARNSLVMHIENLTATVKSSQREIDNIEGTIIPELLVDCPNLDRIVFPDGTQLQIKDRLDASIAVEDEQKRAAAFAWLEANGHGDVIKDQVVMIIGRGEEADKRAKAIEAFTEKHGIDDWTRKRAVHPATLKALITEQLQQGVDVPKETFNVFQQKRAVIKATK